MCVCVCVVQELLAVGFQSQTGHQASSNSVRFDFVCLFVVLRGLFSCHLFLKKKQKKTVGDQNIEEKFV